MCPSWSRLDAEDFGAKSCRQGHLQDASSAPDHVCLGFQEARET